MQKSRRKPLEDWQKQDAARLKELYEKAGPKTQERFGARFGIGSQALVWQYLNGYIPLNLKAALKFAHGLSCDIADFSPTLAAELPESLRRPADQFTEMVDAMPANDAQQVLDFITYKLEGMPQSMQRLPFSSVVTVPVVRIKHSPSRTSHPAPSIFTSSTPRRSIFSRRSEISAPSGNCKRSRKACGCISRIAIRFISCLRSYVLPSNPALKRDAPKAARPLAMRSSALSI
jgi:transcriptional regulator with XRE-family HTH domain